MTSVKHAELVIRAVDERTVWRHLKLTADDDRVGVGEYTTERAPEDLDEFARSAASQLVGAEIDPDPLEALRATLDGSFGAWTIISALDQALEDLRARRAAVPLGVHLSSTASLEPVPLYANINRRTRSRSPEDFSSSAQDALNAGFDAIKIAPFDGLTPPECHSPHGQALIAAGLDRIRAVSATIAGMAELRVDCHWRFTFDQAKFMVPALADLGVVWFECPIPESPNSLSQLRQLRTLCSNHGMRLAGCELMNGLSGFRPYIEGEAYDVIMPDVKYAGGLSEIMRIAELAERSNMSCSIHNPTGPVAHMFSAHLASALGGVERLEFQFDESPLFFQIVEPAPLIRDGRAILTKTPGLGAAMVESK